MIKVHIADDHPLVREGIKKILAEEPSISVASESEGGLDVVGQVKKQDIDIVLLDISMPDKDGLDVLKDLIYTCSDVPAIILSMYSEESFAIRALKAGAAGYVNKRTAPEELIKAIKVVMSGRKYISANLAEQIAEQLDKTLAKPLHETLSDREFQVYCLLARGKKVKEIASELSLSVRTIYSFRMRIFYKMKMKSEVELATYAIQNNLLDC